MKATGENQVPTRPNRGVEPLDNPGRGFLREGAGICDRWGQVGPWLCPARGENVPGPTQGMLDEKGC